MIKKFFSLVIMASLALGAAAQFSNSGNGGGSVASDNEGWSTVYLEWNPITIHYTGKTSDYDDYDDPTLTGFSLGYSHAFSLTSSTPLFVEVGGAAQFAFHKETSDYDDDSSETTMLASIKVPVNLLYKFELNNSSIALMPFLGLTVRGNVWGQSKYEYEDYDGKNHSETADLFNKKDMGKDGVWKRVQVGWQIGLKARFGEKFIVGGSYGTDFNDIAKKYKARTGTISVGLII